MGVGLGILTNGLTVECIATLRPVRRDKVPVTPVSRFFPFVKLFSEFVMRKPHCTHLTSIHEMRCMKAVDRQVNYSSPVTYLGFYLITTIYQCYRSAIP